MLTSIQPPFTHAFKKSLTYSYNGMYCILVPRAATTTDAFNAVAEPRRREILNYLVLRERPVGDIVVTLRLGQPSVSKHLRVLRNVGLVHMRREGRQKFHRTNAEAIKPLHEWTSSFERYWQQQLSRIKQQAEKKVQPEANLNDSKENP
jgi:DNA-binding transcriptional ArsR family regulator